MSPRRLAILIGLCGWLVAGAAVAQTPPASSRKFALLVGCTKYSALGPRYTLLGPANDVALFERLLRDRFRFGDADIIRLVHTNGADAQPRYANIVRAMDRLVAEARAGDHVLILFSGHGSQQLDDKLGGDEEDGLDEVFLPEDVRAPLAEGPKGRVPGITDDRIDAWLSTLRERGAFVFFVVDTCHSGTMARAGDADENTTFRFVPKEELATAEELAEIAKLQQREPVGYAKPQAKDGIVASGSAGGLAALYAVPPHALEQEHAMPPPNNGPKEPRYGRLCYALNQILLQAPGPLTYRELAQRVTWQYRSWNWFPWPVLEASSLDREVLDKREWRDRSALLLSRSADGTLELDQGLAHGLTIGSIVKATPIGEAAKPNACYLRITGATPIRATVEPTTFGSTPAVSIEQVATPSRCEVVEVDYGRLQVSVSVRPDKARTEGLATVEKLVASMAARKDSLVRMAAEGESSDVMLVVSPRAVVLRRRGEFATEEPFALYAIDDELRPALLRDLRQIALAQNLFRLSEVHVPNEPRAAGPRSKERFALEIDVERSPAGGGEFTPVASPAEARFVDGDLLRIRLRNVGQAPLDATVLYVDSRLKIQSQYPTLRAAQAGTYNTIEPRKSHEVVIKINDRTTGWEDVLVFAVAHQPPVSANFAFLGQPGLTRDELRTLRGGTSSPLDDLLGAALGGARGTSRSDEPATFAIRRIGIEVSGPQRRKPE